MPGSGSERKSWSPEGGVETAGEEQLGAVLELARSCPECPAWSTGSWREFLRAGVEGEPRRVLLLAWVEEQLGGVLAASAVEGTTELELVIVRPGARRRGVARRLTESWLAWAEELGQNEALLEVRESNEPARRLYAGLGFQVQGRRRGYYSRPTEDAILMGRTLPRAAGE